MKLKGKLEVEKKQLSIRELELKLKEQHRNTRHDAIEVVQNKINKLFGDGSRAYFYHDEVSAIVEEITKDIQNLKQRKP